MGNRARTHAWKWGQTQLLGKFWRGSEAAMEDVQGNGAMALGRS